MCIAKGRGGGSYRSRSSNIMSRPVEVVVTSAVVLAVVVRMGVGAGLGLLGEVGVVGLW